MEKMKLKNKEEKNQDRSNEIVIDATNAILGRLASFAAKKALLGNSVVIVNCKKAIITGRPKFTLQNYYQKIRRGGTSQKGPNFPRVPEKIVKRTVRGMLSYKEGRGKEAFKRIKCYNEIPEEFKNIKRIIAGKAKESTFIILDEMFDK